MSIKKIVRQIDKEMKAERDRRITEAMKEFFADFCFDHLSIGKNSIQINGIALNNINIDQYNNFGSSMPKKKFPLEMLYIFGELIIAFFENEDSYQHRAKEGLYIQYFRHFCRDLSIEEIQQIINWSDADKKKFDSGIGEWLLKSDGRSCHLTDHRPDLDRSQFKFKGGK